MERGVQIAFGLLGLLLVVVIGAGVAFVVLASDPTVQARQQCSTGRLGPGMVSQGSRVKCTDFHVTSRTANRVEYTFNLSDGSHCQGSSQTDRRGGPLGLFVLGGSSGSACAPAGQPLYGPGNPGPAPTPFPDGNPPCIGAISFAGPTVTATGFEVTMTNTSTLKCDVSGPGKVLFLDASNRPLNVLEQPGPEAANPVVLVAGGSAVLDFDLGTATCEKPLRMVVVTASASQQLASPAVVCGPVIAHAVRPAG